MDPTFEHEGLRLRWDPERRLVEMDFTREDIRLTEEMARVVTRQMRAYVGDGPYSLLVDTAPIAEADAGWRAVWADFFRGDRLRARVACFAPRPFLRTIIRMFILAARLDGAAFARREEAEAWLARPREVARDAP